MNIKILFFPVVGLLATLCQPLNARQHPDDQDFHDEQQLYEYNLYDENQTYLRKRSRYKYKDVVSPHSVVPNNVRTQEDPADATEPDYL